MSRIGNLPVDVPKGVTVDIGSDAIKVKGPKGELSRDLVPLVAVKMEDDAVVVHRDNDSKQARSNHGLMRSLIGSMVEGVTEGFEKKLQVIGIGYRADVRGKDLVLQLGYSHPVEFAIPSGIDIEVDKTNTISVKGVDKQQVGQVAAVIRGFRPPDSYKGKGVRYVDERIFLKAGKTA